jgi:hypothetical protein
MTEAETCRIEFTRDKRLFDYGDNYGAWIALSALLGKDRLVGQIEVFPTDGKLSLGSQSDNDFYNAGNVLLVEILMQDGWKISAKDTEGRVTDMRRAN